MREAKIILPHADNEGRELTSVHNALMRDLCLAFGGATITDGRGAWVDGGKTYDELVRVFHVAAEATARNMSDLRRLARFHAVKAKQLAVYLVNFDGVAEILKLNEREAA